MTEVLCATFYSGDYVKSEIIIPKPGMSKFRNCWREHMPNCTECKKQLLETLHNSNNKSKVLSTMPYRSSEPCKRNGIYTVTFLCGTKCFFRVGVATEPLPVAKKTPSRRVNVGRAGETVVRDHKYMVSPEEADWRREVVRNNKKRVRANQAAKERGELSCGVSTFWEQYGL